MSLVNPNDIIIPNTVGIITSAVREANRHLDQHREHSEYEDSKNRNMASYIREIPQIQFILQNRVNGIPLEQLVDASRISNDKTRAETKENNTKQEMVEQSRTERAYEDWFRG